MNPINNFSERVTELGNTGFKDLVQNKIGVFKGMFLGLNGTLKFADANDALVLADWETKMKLPKNQRAYLCPLFDSIEDISTEDVYVDGLQGKRLSEKGKIGFKAMISVNKFLALNLQGFNGKDIDVVLFDESSSLIGKTTNGTDFDGISATVRFETQKLAAAGELMMQPVTVTFKDSDDWSFRGAVLEPMNETPFWNPQTDVDGVYDVALTVTNPAVTGFKVAVNKKSIDTKITTSGVSGLVKADFILKSALGVVKTITTVEESDVIGVYDIIATVVSTDTIEIVPTASISIATVKIDGLGVKTTITI